MTPLALVAVALGVLCPGFALLYAGARRLDNYSIVDIAWSYAFGLAALFYAWAGPGWKVRRMLIAAIAVIWSLRLGTHLWARIRRHHPAEDGRYRQLRKDWQSNFAARMFGFFQMQALSVVGLGLVFLLPCLNPSLRLHPLEVAGVALWLAAIGGESLADHQLAAFQREPANRGRVCDVGLWRYSRHPNYFFEWLTWVAYFVFALPSPWGWTAFFAPLSILYLLLRVTGIPMTEAQSLRSRGDAYRRYQRTTSAFVPWPPRRSDS